MAYDIVTIGSACVDYFADTDSELIRIDTKSTHEALLAFPLGEKILINELNTTTGGGGTNTATAFSRLGFNTGYLGKIGEDHTAQLILADLARENITFLGKQEGKSGVSFVLNSIAQDRSILVYKGANDFLLPQDMPQISAPWIYVSSMLNQSWVTVVDFICAHTSFKVAFNPSSYQAQLGYEQLKRLVERVSVLVMNREEACKYLGRDYHQQWDMLELLQAMIKVPGQIVAITDAANGVWVYHERVIYAAQPLKDLNIVETTGSGDAFAATFTACLMRNLAMPVALHYAMTNAESILQHKGAKEQLLSWEALSQKAESLPRNIKTHRLATSPGVSAQGVKQ